MTDALPRLALSIRQPWAHAVALRWKDIENRGWRQPNPGLHFRGEFAIHASSGMTREEYEDTADFFASRGCKCPPAAELLRGGIIGVGRIINVVREDPSPWFFGPVGLVIADARPVPFIPAVGALGFFKWSPVEGGQPTPPARWMTKEATMPAKRAASDLFTAGQ